MYSQQMLYAQDPISHIDHLNVRNEVLVSSNFREKHIEIQLEKQCVNCLAKWVNICIIYKNIYYTWRFKKKIQGLP